MWKLFGDVSSKGVRWGGGKCVFFDIGELVGKEGETKKKLEAGKKGENWTYPDACLRVLWVGEPNACHTIRLFVEEHDIGDIPYSGTFFPYVLFDLQNGGWVFLRLLLASRPIATSSSRIESEMDGGKIERTSSSSSVKRCFRIATLSHFEPVSWRVDGSSSSQSANLLYCASSQPPNKFLQSNRGVTQLIQLLSLLDDFLFILRVALDRGLLLCLITKVCHCYLHFAGRRRPSQSEIRIVEHLNS